MMFHESKITVYMKYKRNYVEKIQPQQKSIPLCMRTLFCFVHGSRSTVQPSPVDVGLRQDARTENYRQIKHDDCTMFNVKLGNT